MTISFDVELLVKYSSFGQSLLLAGPGFGFGLGPNASLANNIIQGMGEGRRWGGASVGIGRGYSISFLS